MQGPARGCESGVRVMSFCMCVCAHVHVHMCSAMCARVCRRARRGPEIIYLCLREARRSARVTWGATFDF